MTSRPTVRRLAAGEVLFREGEAGDHAYLIESGVVEVYVERPSATHIVGRLGANDLVGEMALISYGARSASVRAIAPAILRIVTQESLKEQLDDTPPLVRHLLRVMLRRSRHVLASLDGAAAAMSEDPDQGLLGTDANEASDQDIAVNRLRIQQSVREAMQRNELELFYQPIVNVAGESVAGFEALVRWRREGTLVPPGEFIWVIEDSNLILEFGRWAIREAAAALRQMQDQVRQPGTGQPLPFCSVNLSVRQFGDPELFPTIRDALTANGLQASHLHLEITESAVLQDLDAALVLLNRCRDLGCKLVVDDFGTGYSSLSYLHRLPVAALKLDRSFIQGSADSERGLPIIRAVARLAEDLGMYVIAEGIETPEQAALCRNVGLAYAQGYLFGHATPLTKALDRLRPIPAPAI